MNGDMATTTVIIQVLLLSYGSRYRGYNTAINGASANALVSDFPVHVQPQFNFTTTQTPWVAPIEGGDINSINLGQTAAQIYASLQTLWGLVASSGGRAIAHSLATPVAFDAPRIAVQNALKALVQSDPTKYAGYVDLSDVDLSNPANSPDGTHYSDLVITSIWAPRLNTVLSTL